MQEIIRLFYFLIGIFLLLALISNILPNFPRLPGDISIEKPGVKVYIPVASAIVISILVSILLNLLRR